MIQYILYVNQNLLNVSGQNIFILIFIKIKKKNSLECTFCFTI